MDRIPPNKKRAREDDIPLPPAHRPIPPSGAGPAAGGVPTRPLPLPRDDGKALRRRDVETGPGPSGALATAQRPGPSTLHPAPPTELDFALSVLATDPPVVPVHVDGQLRYARTLLADMDEGLVIARRSERLDGLYSAGFASARAVVLETSTAVGLSQTVQTGDDFVRHVRACVQAFQARCGAEAPRLTIGHAPDVYAAHLQADWLADGAAAFLQSEWSWFGDGHAERIEVGREEQRGADAEELCRNDVAVAMDARITALRREARACGAHGELMTLPQGALVVPLHGPIDLLDHRPGMPRHERPDEPLLKSASEPPHRDRKVLATDSSHAAAAGDARPALPTAEAEIPDGATVRISDGPDRVYPRAQFVASDADLTVRRDGEASSGLFTQEIFDHLVLALVGPRQAATDERAGGLPSATALLRLDTGEVDYVVQADQAVRDFGAQAGTPVHVRVVVASEDFEARVEAESEDAETLLRAHRVPSHPPPGLSGGELDVWVVERIVNEHNARADRLAQRYAGAGAITVQNNAILLAPDGELVTFEDEPTLVLAPAPSSGGRSDAAPAVRRGDDKGARPAQAEGPRPGPAADAPPVGRRADSGLDGLAPFTRPAGPPTKPPQ